MLLSVFSGSYSCNLYLHWNTCCRLCVCYIYSCYTCQQIKHDMIWYILKLTKTAPRDTQKKVLQK